MADISKAELKKEIQAILKDADLDNTSAKKVRLELQEKLDCDLTERKKEVDQLVMEVIDEQTPEGDSRDLGDEVEAEGDVNATNKNGDGAAGFSVAEFQSQFSLSKSMKNYQDALDLNETYWQEISNQAARDGENSCQTKLVDRDGKKINLVTSFGDYIVKKSELFCEMGRLEEAREACLRALKDLEEKTVPMLNGKGIKLSRNEVKSDLGIVTESLYVCLSNISVQEFDFEKAFEILDRNVLEGLEVRLDALNNHHNTLRQLMTETNSIAKESLEEDFKNSKIIVNPFLENHYIDENGKFNVQSLDKALRIAKNGDSIFLKNGEYALGRTEDNSKIVRALETNVTIIGESTNESILFLFVRFHIRTMAEVQFKRLKIIMTVFPIHVSQGKLIFENCFVEVCDDSFITIDNQQAEIDLHLCSFTSAGNSSVVRLKHSDSTIKMNIKNCLFTNFKFIITDFRETRLRCGFELHVESCSFLGLKLAMIALENFNPSPKEVNSTMDMIEGVLRGQITLSFILTYTTSVVIRNCFVEVCSSIEDVSHIMDIDNAGHVIIESTKFNAKRGDLSAKQKPDRVNTGLRFANIRRVEIINVIVIREGIYSTLACLQKYLEKPPNVGCQDDAAIQLTIVHEATIRDSIFNGFYCGITTKSNIPDVIFNKAKKVCFTGVYNCRLSNMAVCVLLDSNFSDRSIFALSDISLQDSLVGVRVSEVSLQDSLVGVRVSKKYCDNGCDNGCVDVLDTKFISTASPILLPKVLKKDAKDDRKNFRSRLEMKNLTFPGGESQNVSRKKRRDDTIKNLMKAGVLDPTASIPYLEKLFNPGGNYLEIANEKDLDESRPQSTSDYQSDYDDSVD